MEVVKWIDKFGEEQVFQLGKDGNIFHVVPSKKDDKGNSYVQILSKAAMIELLRIDGFIVKKLTESQLKDLEDCYNSDGNKECLSCACNVCIAD